MIVDLNERRNIRAQLVADAQANLKARLIERPPCSEARRIFDLCYWTLMALGLFILGLWAAVPR